MTHTRRSLSSLLTLTVVLALSAAAQLGCGGGGGSTSTDGCTAGQTQACYTGAEGTSGVGACHAGLQACAGSVWGSCEDEQVPVAEACNGVDDNCDSVVDEGCDCVDGTTQPCYSGPAGTEDVGTCHGGTQTCTAGAWGACAGEQVPVAEVCDAVDDDCDGVVDDSCTGCPADPLADPGFEGGSPSSSWTEASTNFGTPLCTVGACGVGGGSGPRTGTWWAWFGGTSAAEVGSMQQSVVIAPGLHFLRFYVELPVCSTNGTADYLVIQLDGTELYRVDAASALCGVASYQAVDVDVSAYADGQSHTLTFASTTVAASGSGTNFFVDDLSLACAVP